MHNRFSIAILSLWTILLSACHQMPEKKHEPRDPEGFILHMRQSFDSVNQARETVSKDSLRKMIQNTHRSLYARYPVYYDWWLQDGKDVHWLRESSFSDQLSQRMQKVNLPGSSLDNPDALSEAFHRYLNACIKRREERLSEFTDKPGRQIVYTKFEVLRPSFFAYTEGLSDARDECNFIPGSELSLLTMNGIWGEEKTLMKDSTGVFRDPDIHFDGKHILFSWKKSRKEDDFHLYEMDVDSKQIKQLTDGLGYADIEPVYLPDGNILFNSTRNGNAVDCWKVEVSNLYLCDRDGRHMRRVGYDQVHTSNPTVLDDGRVV
ncbi:MAG: hypothetical protein RR346_03380, partial [Bacteroidales bacterium]